MKKTQKSIIEHNVHYREKDGGWQIVISYKNENGNWKQKARQGFKSEAEARRALFPMLKELEQKLLYKLEPTKITFEDFANAYIQRVEATKSLNTVSAYISVANAFAALNEKRMTEITSADIQEIVDGMMDQKENTIKTYLGRLRTMFSKAVKPYKLRVDNPVTDIEVKRRVKPPEPMRALTDQEFESLFKIFRLKRQHIFILLMGTCGLRCGEALGLTWKDVDFKSNTLTVRQQWKLYDKTHYGFGTLKTENSYRTIPLPPRTRDALQQYKRVWNFNADGRIVAYCGCGYANALFRDKLRDTKLKVTPHDLRHTYATTLIRAGLDFKSVAKLLGHRVEVTMSTYSHVTRDMDEKSAKVINEIFGRVAE